LKKPTGSVWFRFYKPETEKTEKTELKPEKTESNGKNRAKTNPNRKNQAKSV
jgi:hypothetical protein